MSNYLSYAKKAKPFLKWAGGKKQHIDFIKDRLPHEIYDSKIDKYFEPFLGGGAVFFYLICKFEIKHVYLSDINKDLILTYNVIKKRPAKLINSLIDFSTKFPKDDKLRRKYYEDIRDDFNDSLDSFDYNTFSDDHILRASQMIFLNKTCFNGLYRVNKSGKFNVPMGKYKNPAICDESNIWCAHKVLKKVDKICCIDYFEIYKQVDQNSFIYLDPPYLPIKKTSFTNYTSESFGITEQERLSGFCQEIKDEGAKFMLSNSKPTSSEFSNFFNEQYKKSDFDKLTIDTIRDAKRYINSNGKKRSNIQEILIYNY